MSQAQTLPPQHQERPPAEVAPSDVYLACQDSSHVNGGVVVNG